MNAVSDKAICMAVNMAILHAHRLGEPRVLELPRLQCSRLRFAGDPADWSMAPPLTYRGLRVTETDEPLGRVLVWDRARETEMVQVIRWSG